MDQSKQHADLPLREARRGHLEFARAFERFPAEAGRFNPGWRNVLDAAA